MLRESKYSGIGELQEAAATIVETLNSAMDKIKMPEMRAVVG